MLKPYYSLTMKVPDMSWNVDIPVKFKTYDEAERFAIKALTAAAKELDDISDLGRICYTITPASESVGLFGSIIESWNRPTGHEIAEAMLAALAVLAVCGFVLAVWGLIESIL